MSATKKKDVLAGRDPTMQLYRAIRRYVESGGGNILVIGGIEVQQWPGDPAHAYRVAVKITGKKPVFAAQQFMLKSESEGPAAEIEGVRWMLRAAYAVDFGGNDG